MTIVLHRSIHKITDFVSWWGAIDLPLKFRFGILAQMLAVSENYEMRDVWSSYVYVLIVKVYVLYCVDSQNFNWFGFCAICIEDLKINIKIFGVKYKLLSISTHLAITKHCNFDRMFANIVIWDRNDSISGAGRKVFFSFWPPG